MKLLIVSGARPNYMKIAPIVWELRKPALPPARPIRFVLVHTGQHHDPHLFDVFFRELDLPRPDHNLGVGSASHAAQTAEIMLRFEPILQTEQPDLVLVVGDVNSTLACALTAAKLLIPVAHVEAGLRSFDRSMPEEINRALTDAIADYLFTTEPSANENLVREGISPSKVFFVGNVMIDTLLRQRTVLDSSRILTSFNLPPNGYGVLTLHRPSNVDDSTTFRRILDAILEISRHIPIIFPCHPRTQKHIEAFGFRPYFTDGHAADSGRIHLIPAIGYLDFLQLLSHARLVLTDSGGIQEETTVLGVPCLTLRENTERPVTVTHGTNTVVGSDPVKIVREARNALDGKFPRGRVPDLWDGKAAQRIVAVLRNLSSSVDPTDATLQVNSAQAMIGASETTPCTPQT